MIYLSSTTGIPTEYQWNEFGVMFSAKHTIGGLDDALASGAAWMMDNNEFVGDFDAQKWTSALLRYLPYRETCLGIPVRDKVGDALETLRRFAQYHTIVRDLGYPVAFVTQDGVSPEFAPWQHFDVLFVGGTDDHKLGAEALAMIAEAKRQGKHVHIGRVNSASRIRQFWMADSVDGTELTKLGPVPGKISREDRIRERAIDFAHAVQYCRNRKSGTLDTNGQYKLLQEAA